MSYDLVPDPTDFLETFGVVGDYDPDTAEYTYNIELANRVSVAITFSINSLATSIKMSKPEDDIKVDFFFENVKKITVNRDKKGIFFEFYRDSKSEIVSSMWIIMNGSVEINVSSMRM